MDDLQFAGIQNVTGGPVKSMFDGRVISFAKDEIKVLDAGRVQFLLQRTHVVSDGKIVSRRNLYKSVPLAEALKHVKEPQNKSVAEAKKEAEAKEAQRAALKAELLAEIEAEAKAKAAKK